MINLLEHNCSIFAIMLVLKVIIRKIIRKSKVTDNLN